jgi:carboxynorspermidine decarboxylase
MHPASDDDDLSALETPALVYDQSLIEAQLRLFARVRDISGARLLYSIKAQPFAGLLKLMAPALEGFSVSSLFEARLASEIMQARPEHGGAIHLTTPGLRDAEIDELGRLCSAISFNSLEQCQRGLSRLNPSIEAGIRVNPELSVLGDDRYDPCRPRSKLGVPLESFAAALRDDKRLAHRLTGIHFHTQFETRTPEPLQATLDKIENVLAGPLEHLQWLNIGGGYLPRNEADAVGLGEVIRGFRERHALSVWIEPGKALIGAAGSLVTRVVDCFHRNGQAIAVLDTGVQHLPEVFEYQKSPQLREHVPDGPHSCLLVGSTCLAGDVFGEYRFSKPLVVGARLCFEQVGAYSLIKASRFNGYDLPTIHLRDRGGTLRLMKAFGYADYHRQWSA